MVAASALASNGGRASRSGLGHRITTAEKSKPHFQI
jgi:hypothetical protein